MDAISRHGHSIEFNRRLPPAVRVFLLICGLFPLYAPYDLLIRPSWRAGLWPAALFPLLVSIGAMAVGGFFIFAALLGVSQCIHFDATTRTIAHSGKTALTRYSENRYSFRDVEELMVKAHSWSDGPTTYDIVLKIKGARGLEFGGLESQEEAERYVAILKKIIQE